MVLKLLGTCQFVHDSINLNKTLDPNNVVRLIEYDWSGAQIQIIVHGMESLATSPLRLQSVSTWVVVSSNVSYHPYNQTS